MLTDQTHKEILIKFNELKGTILEGKKEIKGFSKEQRVLPDEYVSEQHILHDLIRGFYKPAKKNFLLSYLATESIENYGQQIEWTDENHIQFNLIKMIPPSGEKDNRKKSDIDAARYSMTHQIPLGILHKISKGVYRILGLGIIVEENEEGIFIVKPFNDKNTKWFNNPNIVEEDTVTFGVNESEYRIGQAIFKDKLLNINNHCELCDISANYSIASHIKPWNVSNSFERLDVDNGFLFCPNHDFLFDRGYISFRDNGTLILSNLLNQFDSTNFNLHNATQIKINENKRTYVDYHRKNIFKK